MRKRIFSERGQSSVLFALALVVMMGFAAFSVDIGVQAHTKRRLQNAADAAAMSGAFELPNADAARTAAREYAELNGVEAAAVSVTTPYDGNADLIEVVCTETVPYTFARVLGFNQTEVTARAVAESSGQNGPFGYALFSGDPGFGLNLYGGYNIINGGVHSNYSITLNGNEQHIDGSVEAVTSFTMIGSDQRITGRCQAATITTYGERISIQQRYPKAGPYVEMLDFSEEIKEAARAAGQCYHGDRTYNGCNINVNAPIYIDGNLTINGDTFHGNGVVLVSGNITFNGSNPASAGSSVCFYSQHGNITINGDSAVLDGLVYAPEGSIIFNGSNQTVHGRVVGYRVYFNGDRFTISAGTEDFDFLPKRSVKLTR